MIKELVLNDLKIEYELEYKKVKNINLRIKSNGKIYVSANRFVPKRIIDEFVISKADFIKKVLKEYKNREERQTIQYFAEDEIRDVIINICNNVYPYFEEKGIKFPQIKFRKMISQWGNCRAEKGIVTFNTNLMYVPFECVEYVVCHEFTHFLQQNHSVEFYKELSGICPDWKKRREKLKNILLRE